MNQPSQDEILLANLAEGILRLTLNDQSRRNALSDAMLSQLSAELRSAEENGAVRVIVIAANGPAFCAGHDLKEVTAARETEDRGLSYYQQLFASCAAVMQQIVNHPKPVIAEVAGVATAAGCQLVASCDLAVASESARFATPGVNIGLFCSTPMVALSRNVHPKQAMEMLLLGDMISAQRAEAIGLVNQVVSAESLTEVAMGMAAKVASKSAMTLKVGKSAFYAQLDQPLASAYSYTAEVMVNNLLATDAKEGIGAFIEKRPPQWSDE